MTCVDIRERLSGWMDGEDAAPEEVASHLRGCASCSAELVALRNESAALDAAFAPVSDRAALAGERALAALPPTLRIQGAPWWSVVLAAAASFALAWGVFRGPEATAPARNRAALPAVAHLERVVGRVDVKRPGEDWEALASGGGVPAGSMLRTSDAGRARFVGADGVDFRLDAGAVVTVKPGGGMEVNRGQAWFGVPAGKSCRVSAREATADGGAGEFMVSTEGDTAVIRSVSAAVSLHGSDWSGTISPGESRTFGSIVACGPEMREPPATACAWASGLDGGGPEEEEALRRLVFDRLNRPQNVCATDGVSQGLRDLGDRAVPAVCAWLASTESKGNDMSRLGAARFVADMARTEDAPLVAELVGDVDPDVRVEAHRALARLAGSSPVKEDDVRTDGEGSKNAWQKAWSDPPQKP